MKPIALIDLSSLYWTAWHASANGPVSTAFESTLAAVRRCAKDGALVAVCVDRGSSKRKALLPTYKANRPEKDATALEQLRKVQDRLRIDGHLLWGVDGFEADDVIAAAADGLRAGQPVTIYSADKDLLQLLRLPAVSIVRTYGEEWTTWTAATVKEKFGIEPFQIQDWLALVGDKSDNIPGAPGIGATTATKLLQQYGDVAGIYEALAADPTKVLPLAKGGLSAAAKSLIDSEKAVRLALELVKLDPPPLKVEEIFEERKPLPLVTDEEEPMERVDTVDAEFAQEQPKEATTAPEKPVPTNVALVPVDPDYQRGLEPRSSVEAWEVAKHLLNSRLYSKLPTREAIFAVICRGRELGLGMGASLDCFHFVEGRLMLHAHLIVSLAEKLPDCEYIMCVETTATAATYEAKHRKHPRPTRITYTLEEATRAGLAGRPIWKARTAEMLRKTAAVQCVRVAFPSAAMGLCSFEEMGMEP